MPSPSEPSPIPTPFRSFVMGGFECATHRRRDGTRLDVTAATAHDIHCEEDYRLLQAASIRTVRDGVRWHLAEPAPGVYDWTSLLPLIDAANATGTQVIWDLCHWGVPDWLDMFSADFAPRLAAFARAAVSVILARRTEQEGPSPDLFCAINEISFWAWVGGDEEHFHPYGGGRGPELKRQLVLASLAAIRAVRELHRVALFVQPEPLIYVTPEEWLPEDNEPAAAHTESQFEALDMLLGRTEPALGGAPDAIDIVGLNIYWNNQWIKDGERTPLGHDQHRSLHLLLGDVWRRYGLPIVITETGAEGSAAAGWLGYIAAEVRQAQRLGASVLGICLYPVMDYTGWDNERHCACGLIAASPDWTTRELREDFAAEVRLQASLLSNAG